METGILTLKQRKRLVQTEGHSRGESNEQVAEKEIIF